MQATDRPSFVELMTEVLAFFRQEATTFTLGVWWEACRPFSLEQVRKALSSHATDPERGRFPPMPADLVRLLNGTHTDRSLMAWSKVFEAVHRVGLYSSVVFDDPAIHAAIEDMGGWPAICLSKQAELAQVQRRFCETYRAYALRPGMPYPRVLVGLHEAANRFAGQDTHPPMLIGDPKRCEEIRAGGAAAGRLQITAAKSVAHGASERVLRDSARHAKALGHEGAATRVFGE